MIQRSVRSMLDTREACTYDIYIFIHFREGDLGVKALKITIN